MTHAQTPYPIFAAIDANPKLLTREQEHCLAVRAREGDQRARGELVERNLRLVIKIAATFAARAPQFELLDLVSEGVLGLMRAIDKFDPDSGFKLSTYATWWITQAVSRAADRDGTVTMPADVRREIRCAEHYTAGLLATDPSTEEVHAELAPAMRERIDHNDVDIARAAMSCASLDYPAVYADGQSTPLASLLADPQAPDPCAAVAERLDLENDIAALTKQLSDVERTLVEQRFGLAGCQPAPLAQIARNLRIETAEARRLERSAFTSMRSAGGLEQAAQEPCRPAAAVLDLLQHGRRESSPARLGSTALRSTRLSVGR